MPALATLLLSRPAGWLAAAVFALLDALDVLLCLVYGVLDGLLEDSPVACYCHRTHTHGADEGVSDTLYVRRSAARDALLGLLRRVGVGRRRQKIASPEKARSPRWSDCGCRTCLAWRSTGGGDRLHFVVNEPKGRCARSIVQRPRQNFPLFGCIHTFVRTHTRMSPPDTIEQSSTRGSASGVPSATSQLTLGRCSGDKKSRRRRHLRTRLHVVVRLLGGDRVPGARRREPQAARRRPPRLRRQPQAGQLRVHAARPRRGDRAEPRRPTRHRLLPPGRPLDGLRRRRRRGRQAPCSCQIGHARRAAVLPAVRGEGEPGGAAHAGGEEALAAAAVRLGGHVLVRARRQDGLPRRLQEPPGLGVAHQDRHPKERRGLRGQGPDEAHPSLGVEHHAQRDLRRGGGAGPEPGGPGGGGSAGQGGPRRRGPGGAGRVQQPSPEIEAPTRGDTHRGRTRPPDGGVRQGERVRRGAPRFLVSM